MHHSEIGDFCKWLGRKGFRKQPLKDWEMKKFFHPVMGFVIIYETKKANPFPRLNENGQFMFGKYQEQKK